jgi:DNA (cytosine-5)-methyltransferase 1
MKALDLFCCDGGAAIGLNRAGFDEIVGIDIASHPNYPFDFIQMDLTKGLPIKLDLFDFIWASPPCQQFTTATNNTLKMHGNRCRHGKEYPNHIPLTRKLLQGSGKPYVIENVPNAPIKKHLVLCGSMFNLKTYRHRHFELSGFRCEQPRHPNHFLKTSKAEMFCIVGDTPLMPGQWGDKIRRKEGRKKLRKVIEEQGGVTKLYQNTMGIFHTEDRLAIAEAVPPAYSEYIGKEFFRTREFYSCKSDYD